VTSSAPVHLCPPSPLPAALPLFRVRRRSGFRTGPRFRCLALDPPADAGRTYCRSGFLLPAVGGGALIDDLAARDMRRLCRAPPWSEEHTPGRQSRENVVGRVVLE